MITTECILKVYKQDGKEVPLIGGPKLLVRSVSPLTTLVELEFANVKFEVSRRDLEAALDATSRTGDR